MARLIDRFRGSAPPSVPQAMDFEARAGFVGLYQSWQGLKPTEGLGDDFRSYTQDGYKGNAVVFAIILARMSLFSDVEFAFQRHRDRELFTTDALGVLEQPWPNGTTGEMLARLEQDTSLSGNAYLHIAAPDRLQRLRPDWVKIITDGKEPIGYLYYPGNEFSTGIEDYGGPGGGTFIPVEEMIHWSPIPDPLANFRGMSWLTPVVREILADKGMTAHKEKFFENAATPNLLVKVANELSDESRQRIQEMLNERFNGANNAYKTMVLEAGADATVIGANMAQMSFDAVQAAGENRITAAAGVPGIVVGLKEGLQAATYSNYAQALRRWVDVSMRWQWRSVSVALAKAVQVPSGSRLWYDASHTAALRQDEADRAEILLKKSQSAILLSRAGYDQEDIARVVEAMEGFDTLSVATAPLFPAGIPNPPDAGTDDPTNHPTDGATPPVVPGQPKPAAPPVKPPVKAPAAPAATPPVTTVKPAAPAKKK